MNINLHDVTGIHLTETRKLDSGGHAWTVRDIIIATSNGDVTVTVFGPKDVDIKDALKLELRSRCQF